jgi:hypothetical protein
VDGVSCFTAYVTRKIEICPEVSQPKLSLELSHCSSVILYIIFLSVVQVPWQPPPFSMSLQAFSSERKILQFSVHVQPNLFPKIKNWNICVKFTTIINNAHSLYYILLSCLYGKTL